MEFPHIACHIPNSISTSRDIPLRVDLGKVVDRSHYVNIDKRQSMFHSQTGDKIHLSDMEIWVLVDLTNSIRYFSIAVTWKLNLTCSCEMA